MPAGTFCCLLLCGSALSDLKRPHHVVISAGMGSHAAAAVAPVNKAWELLLDVPLVLAWTGLGIYTAVMTGIW